MLGLTYDVYYFGRDWCFDPLQLSLIIGQTLSNFRKSFAPFVSMKNLVKNAAISLSPYGVKRCSYRGSKNAAIGVPVAAFIKTRLQVPAGGYCRAGQAAFENAAIETRLKAYGCVFRVYSCVFQTQLQPSFFVVKFPCFSVFGNIKKDKSKEKLSLINIKIMAYF